MGLPIVAVPKASSDGETIWRMVVDATKLNSQSSSPAAAIPNVSDLIGNVSGAKYFAVFDMSSGYLQFPVTQRTQKFLAIVTHLGHFEYTRLIFGLKGAGAYFQNIMGDLIKDKLCVELH